MNLEELPKDPKLLLRLLAHAQAREAALLDALNAVYQEAHDLDDDTILKTIRTVLREVNTAHETEDDELHHKDAA